MSGHFGSHSRHHAPGTFRVVLGQVQLQLCIDRFADQAQAVELSLSRLRTCWWLVHFARSQQFQRAILFKRALKSRIIVGSIPKQPLEVMRKRVQEFHHWLIVVAAGWGEQEAHDDPRQTDHTVECAAKVLHGLAATHSIVGSADKSLCHRLW